MHPTRKLILAGLIALPAIAAADGLAAVADLKGCTNAAITGTATLKEQVTRRGREGSDGRTQGQGTA